MEQERRGRGRPRGTSKKVSKVEQELWIKQSIKKIMGEHLSYKQYLDWSYKNGFSANRANEYWKICWTFIRDKYELDKSKQISKHLHKYWELYDTAVFNNDISNARQLLDAIAKMMGLNEADRIDINASGTIEFKFGDE